MANTIDTFTRKVMDSVLPAFEEERTLTKNVNTQLFQGKFNSNSGPDIDVQRPLDYKSIRSSNGDITGVAKSDLITGKATATVQDQFTVWYEYDELDEAIKLGNLEEKTRPSMTRIANDFEVDFAAYMMKNSALQSGTVGTGISTWSDVANAYATMDAKGVPHGNWCAAINPYTVSTLADVQNGLADAGGISKGSWEKGLISTNMGGLRVMSSSSLATYTTGTGADRAGTVVGTPVATYLGAKDSMTQTIGVTAFQANLVVAAGETVTVTAASGAINQLNLATRQPIVNGAGAAIVWTGTVTETVTLDGSGAGNLVVTGPAIYEATGAYNTVSQAIAASDVITLSGAADSTYQPALFWQKDAFVLASVPMKRLYSTDTIATTKDGMQFRVSKGTDFDANSNKVRVDFRPAYGTMNPFFAGQLFG